jgi:hypothetical protein
LPGIFQTVLAVLAALGFEPFFGRVRHFGKLVGFVVTLLYYEREFLEIGITDTIDQTPGAASGSASVLLSCKTGTDLHQAIPESSNFVRPSHFRSPHLERLRLWPGTRAGGVAVPSNISVQHRRWQYRRDTFFRQPLIAALSHKCDVFASEHSRGRGSSHDRAMTEPKANGVPGVRRHQKCGR